MSIFLYPCRHFQAQYYVVLKCSTRVSCRLLFTSGDSHRVRFSGSLLLLSQTEPFWRPVHSGASASWTSLCSLLCHVPRPETPDASVLLWLTNISTLSMLALNISPVGLFSPYTSHFAVRVLASRSFLFI